MVIKRKFEENCYVFAVGNGKEVRIMAAKLNYNTEAFRHELDNLDISETFIELGDLNQMISQL